METRPDHRSVSDIDARGERGTLSSALAVNVAAMSSAIGQRALNRATLARQFLLHRVDADPMSAVQHLVGMQAQAPESPYLGLWTRLRSFEPGELTDLLLGRRVVRSPLMRATIHLVVAADSVALRPLVQPVLERSFGSQSYARNLVGLELDTVVAAGRAALAATGLTRSQLGEQLARRWPERDPTSLAYAISYLLPVIQAPPRGLWQAVGPTVLVPTDTWLPDVRPAAHPLDDLVLRYLAAFGPASVHDMQTWCGLTRLREIFDRLEARLLRFTGPSGATLYDLPSAPRPDPDTPAPPRFLPEYDNLLLSHADRTRFMSNARRVPLRAGNGARQGTLLLDGRYVATWRLVRRHDELQLSLDPHEAPLEFEAVEAEAARLLRFLGEDPGTAIRLETGRTL